MMNVESFEEFKAWKFARMLTKDIYDVTSMDGFCRHLRNKMRRTSGAIMDDIARGLEKERINESIHFFQYVKSNCCSLKSQLCRANDVGYIDEKSFVLHNQKIKRIYELLGDLINSRMSLQ